MTSFIWGVRWYWLYPISYRNLEEMMYEKGVEVDHTATLLDTAV